MGTVGDIADVIDCLHSKKPTRQPEGKPLLQLNNIRNDGLLDLSDIFWISDKDYTKWISRCEAKKGDCVITNVGRVGAVAQIPKGFNAALGRNMTAIRCRSGTYYPTYLIECLLSSYMRKEIERKTDTGTILNALNVRNIPLLRISLPPHHLLQVFEECVRPIRSMMEDNLNESLKLSQLRDILLPKLMDCTLAVDPTSSKNDIYEMD